MVSNAKIFLQDYPERSILSNFYEVLRVLSPSRMLLLFSLTFSLSWLEKSIKIYGVDIPRRCIESRHFYLCPPPQLKFTSKFLSSRCPQAIEIYSFSSGSVFFENNFLPNSRKRWSKIWFALLKFSGKI